MPLAASTFLWPMLRLLGAVCLALAVGIVASYGLSSVQDTNIRRSVGWVEHTHEVIKAIDDILDDAVDVETGQRGFLETGEASYLSPYWHGLASIQGHLARARELAKDNLGQQERLQILGALLHAR